MTQSDGPSRRRGFDPWTRSGGVEDWAWLIFGAACKPFGRAVAPFLKPSGSAVSRSESIEVAAHWKRSIYGADDLQESFNVWSNHVLI